MILPHAANLRRIDIFGRDNNLKMIDMAHANTEGVFEFARQLATAKSPSDMSSCGRRTPKSNTRC